MTLADFTNQGLIVPRLHGQDSPSVIQELSQVMERERRVPDSFPIYHAALNREFLMASNWEAGVAFPHARLQGLKELFFALGRSEQPLGWGAEALRSVRLVFLIAVPATDSIHYLSLISGLARLVREQRLVQKLYVAAHSSQIFEVLQQVKLRSSTLDSASAAVRP